MASEINGKELLKDRRVVEEINRHLWIESERSGYDVGFDQAAQDWLSKFSKAWMDYHMPGKTASSQENVKPAKKVSAKSYIISKKSKKVNS